MKTLYLTTPPKDVDPDNVIIAGPWCFAGHENDFPDFANKFCFAREPLSDHTSLPQAIAQAKALTVKMLPLVAEKLSSVSLPEVYWQTLLMPWIALLSQQIVERALRVQALLNDWQNTPLEIPILPWQDCHFAFANETDFTFHGVLGLDFNFWLFSWLLCSAKLPAHWHLRTLPPTSHSAMPLPKKSFKERVKSLIQNLPMPPLKGFSLFQSFLFSAALLHRAQSMDHSTLLKADSDAIRSLDELNLPKLLPIYLHTIPNSLSTLKHPHSIKPCTSAHIRCARITVYEDSTYRQRLAIYRAQGNRLIYVQHGGNYGQIRYSCLTAWVEYSQTAFFTWGWKKHGSETGNFIPLPYPQLARWKNSWHGQTENLLFIGTEMPLLGYRLDAHPTPLQILEYREAKKRFLATLPENIRSQVLYRPYFPVPSTLEDAPYIQKLYPNIRIASGDLSKHIKNCKLLILDHHGTTLLEAMAANVPMILYWNEQHWPQTDAATKMFAELEAVGIFWKTPEAAAQKVAQIFADPTSWWQTKEVQAVRDKFCTQYALIIAGSENGVWLRTLWRL
ncbi:MAG: LIC12162 family protein [Desulfovibrio sp.]|nr:LIC12162 family protein [Desulfovibrio sp.]